MSNFIKCTEDGLCKVTLGQFTNDAYCATDVPFNCLTAAINSMKDNVPFAVEFDNGDYHYMVVADLLYSYVIADNGGPTFYKNDTIYGLQELALQIYNDISEDVDGWVNFMFNCTENFAENIETIKTEMLSMLNTLECLLEEEGLLEGEDVIKDVQSNSGQCYTVYTLCIVPYRMFYQQK